MNKIKENITNNEFKWYCNEDICKKIWDINNIRNLSKIEIIKTLLVCESCAVEMDKSNENFIKKQTKNNLIKELCKRIDK